MSILEKLFKPDKYSLKQKSIKAAIWSFLGKGMSSFLRLAGSLIFTRLLYPEVFGLMATVLAVVSLIQLFSDTGVKTAIIQNPRGAEPEFISAAWIITVCRGGFLYFIITVLAYPVSYYYHNPELKNLLLIMAINPMILSLENPSFILFIKKFRAEKQVSLELTTQILGLLTTIVLVYFIRNVYALALGAVLTSIYRVIISYIIHPYRPRFIWQKEAGMELFNFGKFIFLNTIINWSAMNVDIFIIGKFLDMEKLGYYNIGRNIGLLIWLFSIPVFSQSFFPAISSVANDINRVFRIYRRTITFILTITIPASLLVALFSGEITGLLYDNRYQGASVPMFWISISVIFRIISLANANTFFALGRPAFETVSMAVGLLLSLILIPLGTRINGLSGAAIGLSISLVAIPVAESIFLCRQFKFPISYIIRPWIQTLITGGIIYVSFPVFKSWLYTEQFFNLPFISTVLFTSIITTALIYLLLEGRSVFGNMGNKKGIQRELRI